MSVAQGVEPMNNAESSLGSLENGHQPIKQKVGLEYRVEGSLGAGVGREGLALPLGLWAETRCPCTGPGVAWISPWHLEQLGDCRPGLTAGLALQLVRAGGSA